VDLGRFPARCGPADSELYEPLKTYGGSEYPDTLPGEDKPPTYGGTKTFVRKRLRYIKHRKKGEEHLLKFIKKKGRRNGSKS